eukprot:6185234-Pleurochrysis_carterae.AAC.1
MRQGERELEKERDQPMSGLRAYRHGRVRLVCQYRRCASRTENVEDDEGDHVDLCAQRGARMSV